MGYFNGMAAGLFKRDKAGQVIFYPWGVLSKGYIITAKSAADDIRKFVVTFYQVAYPVSLSIGLFAGVFWGFAVLALLLGWYQIRINSLVVNCGPSEERLSVKEGYARSAIHYSWFMLWSFLVGSILIVAMGLYALFNASTLYQVVLAVFLILIMGASGAAIAYMISLKVRSG